MGKDYCIQIINPEDPLGQPIEAIIPYRLYSKYYTFHPVQYENLRTAKYVLEHPLRIFSGVRVFNEGGWCFTGRLGSWYIRETVVAPFPGNLIYAVYLNPRHYVYECRSEHAAQDDKECPDDWQN